MNQLITDLLAAFFQTKHDTIRQGRRLTRMEICEILASQPAPRFYITPYAALRKIILPMEKNGDIPAHGRRRRAMHLEFYQHYIRLRESLSRDKAIAAAIEQPASSFFLSKHRINYLLYAAYHRRNNKR